MRNLLLTTSFALVLSAPAFAAGTHDGGHGETKPAAMMIGMPGEAANVDRTIDVTLLENDEGEMLIESEEMTIKEGETIRFNITNKGELEHEFVLDTVERNAEHKIEMAKMDMEQTTRTESVSMRALRVRSSGRSRMLVRSKPRA